MKTKMTESDETNKKGRSGKWENRRWSKRIKIMKRERENGGVKATLQSRLKGKGIKGGRG